MKIIKIIYLLKVELLNVGLIIEYDLIIFLIFYAFIIISKKSSKIH